MKTEDIFKQIYKDLKDEMLKNNGEIFIKKYEIPSMTYSKIENTDDLWWASGIEMELYQMMKNFDYKVYFSSYKDKYFFGNNAEKVQETMLKEIENETLREQIDARIEARQDEKYKQKIDEKIEDLKQELEEKLDSEYKELIEELKKCTPEKIIDRAYELTVKDEIIGQIKEMNLDETEIKAMLKQDGLLSECYEDWRNADGRLGETIYPTIVDTIDVITSEYEKENKQKKQESR
ncbi:MAG: DUF3848 domain-containing protein [Clostridia bacterium]|nr:DUF3848 domain-containing protein [Clostridia bacterium]